MELLDQYLKSVRPLLPEAQREDILDELSEEIRSHMEGQAAILGRPLTEGEQSAILSRYGHPLIVGGRYQPYRGTLAVGKELIGRELFPFYLKTLKIVLLVGLTGIGLVHAILYNWEPFSFGEFLNRLALQVLIQVGVITTLFSFLQSQLTASPEKWDLWASTRESHKETSTIGIRVEAVIQLVITVTIFGWIQHMFSADSNVFSPAILTSAWRGFYWILVAATALSCGQFAITFVRPDAVRFQRPVRILASALWLAGFVYVYQAGPWLTTPDASKVAQVQEMNDRLFKWGILSMITTLGFVVAWEIGSYLMSKQKAS